MLKLELEEKELFNPQDSTFVVIPSATIQMEHSLISLSKWESKWHVPFLTKDDRTDEQTLDYFRFMTLTQNVNPDIYLGFDNKIRSKIIAYIDEPMTATTFTDRRNPQGQKKEIITAEIIYYWMIAYNIPFECQKWHLNKLLTLIRVCSIKNDTGKDKKNKMNRKDLNNYNRALNEARKKKFNTSG